MNKTNVEVINQNLNNLLQLLNFLSMRQKVGVLIYLLNIITQCGVMDYSDYYQATRMVWNCENDGSFEDLFFEKLKGNKLILKHK